MKVKNNLIKPGERYAVVNDIYPPKWSVIQLHEHGGYTHVQLWNTKKSAIRAISEKGGILSEYIHPEYRPAATPSPLPETAKTVKVKDGGKVKMNDEETAVWWDEEWHEIQEDRYGEFYFLFNGKTWYIEHHNALPETETGVSVTDLLKQREDIEDKIRAIDPNALIEYELKMLGIDEPTPPTPGNERQEGFTQEQAAAMYRALKECREWYEHNAHTIAPNTPICFTKAFEILKTIK